MGIPFTLPMGFLFTVTMGILLTIALAIQLTISGPLNVPVCEACSALGRPAASGSSGAAVSPCLRS